MGGSTGSRIQKYTYLPHQGGILPSQAIGIGIDLPRLSSHPRPLSLRWPRPNCKQVKLAMWLTGCVKRALFFCLLFQLENCSVNCDRIVDSTVDLCR
jgi:hypothetical protein